MCNKNVIPNEFHGYYKNLWHVSGIADHVVIVDNDDYNADVMFGKVNNFCNHAESGTKKLLLHKSYGQ